MIIFEKLTISRFETQKCMLLDEVWTVLATLFLTWVFLFGRFCLLSLFIYIQAIGFWEKNKSEKGRSSKEIMEYL